MTTLMENKLYCVEVPSDATEIQTWNHGIGFKTNMLDRKPDDSNGFYHTETGLFKMKGFKILGEVTEDEVDIFKGSFLDCENSIDIPEYRYGGELHPKEMFWDYEEKSFSLESSESSFRSLLQSKGIYFEHCYGNFIDDGVVGETCCHKPNGIKGKLIILEKL